MSALNGPAPIAERLDRLSMPEPMSGCTLWIGGDNGLGYGVVWHRGGMRRAHRVAWELANGPVPDGLVLDHKCRVRCCINVDHLRAITFRENVLCGEGVSAREARRTACPRGHAYDIVKRDGRRACRTCKNQLRRKGSRAQKEA
jgi:hypothetical protein